MGQLLQFQAPTINYGIDHATAETSRKIEKPSITVSEGESKPLNFISTQSLYPLASEFNPKLFMAMRLLEEGIGQLNEAINMFRNDYLLSSDDAIQRFQALLPELFCCRDLGDGFGAVVNAVFHSLKNLEGIPANQEQLLAIKKIINRIAIEPFLDFEEAVDEIIMLENVKLIVEPSHFKFMADMLIE